MAKIEATGNLGGDAERKTDKNGNPFIVFSVSDEKSRPDGNGGWEKLKQQWLSCALFGDAATYYADVLRKGTRVTVWGEFYARPYEGNSGLGTSLDVNVDAVKVWPPKRDKQQSAGHQGSWGTGQQTQGGRWGQNPNQQGDPWAASSPQNGGSWGASSDEEPPF